MKYVAKQELKSVPFQYLHEKVTLAGRRAVESLVKVEREAHARLIARKEQEWSETHESPYEGNFEELYPFVGPSEALVKKERIEAEQDAIKEQIKTLGLKEKAGWLLPQITAYIAKMSLPRTDGKVDGAKFLAENFSKDDWHKGLYRYCTIFQRGLIVPSQYTEQYKNYSALVPLLMMPFKKYDGIKYSEWTNISNVLDLSLYFAMVLEADNLESIANREDVLAVRNKGLQYQSGDKKGTTRNPVNTFKLYGLSTTSENEVEAAVAGLPWLAQVMVSQIWMAHPSIRTNVMVLDPINWDNMPQPLIDTDPFVKDVALGSGEEKTSTKYYPDLEWLA